MSDLYTSVGASFKYTYNGTTYTMRYATMTGAVNTTTTLNLVGATAWTRIYTQIYDDGEWHNGATVEKVQAKAHMDGYYYDKKTNEYLQVDNTEVKKTVYSDECYDTAWRNEYAIKGYSAVTVWIDKVGDVKYYYGNSKK